MRRISCRVNDYILDTVGEEMNEHWLLDRYKNKTTDELTIDMVFVNEQEQKYIAAELLRREQENV